jgi:DNA-binding NtrC family response regulator
MDGLEVASRIKERRPWIPVVIITGYGTAANEARAAAAGVSGFMRKPLSPEMIEDSTRRALQVIEGGKGKVVEIEDAAQVAAAPVARAPAAVAEPMTALRLVKNVALFFAAPFIGLAYAIAFPFVGLGMLAWRGMQSLKRRSGRA